MLGRTAFSLTSLTRTSHRLGCRTIHSGLAEVSCKSQSDLIVEWQDGASCSVHSLWLRDHCLCSGCRHPTSFHRDVDTFHLSPEQVKLSSAEVMSEQDDQISVTWADGHLSKFPNQWLRAHCMENSTPDEEHHLTSIELVRQQAWSAADMENDLVEVDSEEFSTAEGLRKVVVGIRRHGLVLLHNVPCETSATQAIGERLGGIARTVYKDLWETAPDTSGNTFDQAYSRRALALHTDATYSQHTPALQVFHCYIAGSVDSSADDDLAGVSLFSDGLKVAEQLSSLEPESFEYLCLTPLTYQFSLRDVHVNRVVHTAASHPVFRYNEFGDLLQVAFNTYHRAPQLSHTAEEMYHHLRVANAAFHAKENVFRVLLRPGTVALVDNYRVLHGRTAFQGERYLGGCYVTHDQLQATYREHLMSSNLRKVC